MSAPVRSLYVASKTAHAARWRSLRSAGWRIASSWIDVGQIADSDYPAFWSRCIQEASAADALLLYVEPGEVIKGGFVEMGAALASSKPVLWVGPLVASAYRHPLVKAAPSLEAAAAMLGLPTIALRPIHLCDYASQPDIQIACDQSWDVPKWGGQPDGLPEGVHLRDDDRLYAFERALVTCEACLAVRAGGAS